MTIAMEINMLVSRAYVAQYEVVLFIKIEDDTRHSKAIFFCFLIYQGRADTVFPRDAIIYKPET